MRRDKHSAKPPVRQPHATADNGQSFAFRRSRTITGSAATAVRAAGEDRGQLKSPRLHEHSLRKHRRTLIAYLIISLGVCGTLWYVISSYIGGQVTVGTQSAQPVQNPLETTRYQTLVEQYLNDHPFERFQFAFNEETFSRFIVLHAAEVADAKLDKGRGIGNAELALRLREPVVAWTIKNQQYYVDADGTAYTKNYFATPTVVVSDKSGISADAGVVASTKLLRFIGRVITLVNQSGVASVQSVELPVNSTREVNFRLRDTTYIIKAHLDRDPAGQATDIINAVRYIASKGIQPVYLDVRVSSKAYYKEQ